MLKEVKISIDSIFLEGDLNIPDEAKGVIVFVHGSGSSRLSPRNKFVADFLNQNGFATLLFDLLTEKEDEVYETRFDIELLVKRIKLATDWILKQDEIKDLKIGYFGASTGASAALISAADLGGQIKAIVSRGGRPDLAMDYLQKLKTPTLLIVGGDDLDVIELNQKAFNVMTCEKKLEIVEGATHLFEEAGKLEEVAELARDWFVKYLR